MKKLLFIFFLASSLAETGVDADRVEAKVRGALDAPKFTFSGQVVTTNGQPVEGAVIEYYRPGPSPFLLWRGPIVGPTKPHTTEQELKERLTSDAEGKFEVHSQQAAGLALVRKDGFAPWWINLTHKWPDPDLRVVLTPPVSLVGIVVDEADKPVENAEVWARDAFLLITHESLAFSTLVHGNIARQLFSTRSRADGRFQIDGFPANGRAELAAQAPGRAFRRVSRKNPSDLADPLIPPGRMIRVMIQPAGALEGKVLSEDRAPVPGARLSLAPDLWEGPPPAHATAAPDGSFRFGELVPGKYWLESNFAENQPAEWAASGVSVTVEAGRTIRGVEVIARRGGLLRVDLFTQERNRVRGAVVLAMRQGEFQHAFSDQNGTARLRLVPGEYRLIFSRETLPAESAFARVEAGATNHLEIQFKPPRKITGIVRDPVGQPVKGLKLSVLPYWDMPSASGLKTDENGRYEFLWYFRQTDATYCLLTVDKERELAAAEDIDIETGMLDLQLQPSVRVNGRVETMKGLPVTNALLSVTHWGLLTGEVIHRQMQIDSSGGFQVTGLPADRRYQFTVEAKGHRSSHRDVETSAAANPLALSPFKLRPVREVSAPRVADHDLAGQVLDPNNQPAAKTTLYIAGEDTGFIEMTADEAGRFRVRVCDEQISVIGSRPGLQGTAWVEAGDTNVLIQLKSKQGRKPQPKPKPLPLQG